MKALLHLTALLILYPGCSTYAQQPTLESRAASVIEMGYFDNTVRAQDDFYQHVNGHWLATTPIPADKASYSPRDQRIDDVLAKLREIVERLLTSTAPLDTDERKIADLYSSFMDEAAVDRLRLKPLESEFARVDALTNKAQIASLIAHFNQIGATAPYTPNVHQDAKDPGKQVFEIRQAGLGLPNRDFYLRDDERFSQIRSHYRQHIQRMLALAGDVNARKHAQDIITLETALADVQWTAVEIRDPVKRYNKIEVAKLGSIAPSYSWRNYLANAGVIGKVSYVIVAQPSYIIGFDRILQQTSLRVWQAYFRWHLLSDFAPYLSKPFAEEHFTFYGTILRGIERATPRWQRGIELLDNSIGEGLGKLYVAKYFPPDSKTRMEQLVKNLFAAYRSEFETIDWMSQRTRQKAEEKLSKFTVEIGYPSKWRDYSELRINKGNLIGDVIRAHRFEYYRNLNKLTRPTNRTEWFMTPQTVDAAYVPERNLCVFPAAILPAETDDAANYGSIGAGISHEISHGFDDQGSQYDGDGNLTSFPGWFTQEDLGRFRAKTRALIDQYSHYGPVPGYHINGELTLGENIADNSGLAIAYKAYRLSLDNREAPVIDGLTGDQRFFVAFAQSFCSKMRESEAIARIKFDPHSPAQVRGTVPEMNLAAFYMAFGIKEGDKMYLPPEKRVTLW
jgi:predicted metalloendopeptidase